ncbi:MAG: hypothetical protein DWQ10_06370 [Calditrichaeota bacterium]|nr:MAG: hypothetical protein DWQ10_06370 [Calditrichota bacterium]
MTNDKYQLKDVKVFSSIEEENAYEYSRRKEQSPEERFQEFARLQAQRWGKNWIQTPIKKIVTFEKLF